MSRLKIKNIESKIVKPLSNLIRIILLTKIKSYKVKYIKIKNISHEYDYIDGVNEDIMEICLRIKKIIIKSKNNIKIKIKKKGPSSIYSKELNVKKICKIINNKKIIKINKGFKISITFKITKGSGFSKINNNNNNNNNKIYIENIYSPINKVSYRIKKFKKKREVKFKISTNKSISKEKAFKKAIKIAKINET